MLVVEDLVGILHFHLGLELVVLVLEFEVETYPYSLLEPAGLDLGTILAGLVEEAQNYCLVPADHLEVSASFDSMKRR